MFYYRLWHMSLFMVSTGVNTEISADGDGSSKKRPHFWLEGETNLLLNIMTEINRWIHMNECHKADFSRRCSTNRKLWEGFILNGLNLGACKQEYQRNIHFHWPGKQLFRIRKKTLNISVHGSILIVCIDTC